MTKDTFESNFQRMVMNCPFGHNDPNLAKIKKNGAAGHFNFEDGFDPTYSAPKANNGNFVTRGEMNAIGHLASANMFYLMCGGINQFDSAFAGASGINGYPKNAILDYLVNDKIYKVVSLVDNNTHNYLVEGVTGTYWAYLNQDNADAGRQIAFTFKFNGDTATSIGRFLSSLTSPVYKIDNNLKKSDPIPEQNINLLCQNTGGIITYGVGFAFAIRDLGTTVPSTSPTGPEISVSWNPTTAEFSYTTSSNGWCELVNFDLGTKSICWNKVTDSMRSINVEEYFAATALDIFPGFTQGHYYEVRSFGTCNMRNLLGQAEHGTSSVDATISAKHFDVSGNFSLMY